jgi:hypothetical protein
MMIHDAPSVRPATTGLCLQLVNTLRGLGLGQFGFEWFTGSSHSVFK